MPDPRSVLLKVAENELRKAAKLFSTEPVTERIIAAAKEVKAIRAIVMERNSLNGTDTNTTAK